MSGHIQTRRNPRNKQKHDLQVGYAVRMQNRTKYFKGKLKEKVYKPKHAINFNYQSLWDNYF